jgi:hypothetical protein
VIAPPTGLPIGAWASPPSLLKAADAFGEDQPSTAIPWAGMRTPFLILSGAPTPSILAFADALARIQSQEVAIVSDTRFERDSGAARIIHIEDAEARDQGFVNSSPLIRKTPIAWDKAIYILAKARIAFDHAWIMEDDVLFAKPELASELIGKYRTSDADLIVTNFFRRSEHPDWHHWWAAELFPPDYRAGGFLPLCRVSRRMIEAVSDFAASNGSLHFIETMFPSLAVGRRLSVEIMDFVSERRFRFAPSMRRWEVLYMLGHKLGTGILHPVKSEELRAAAAARSWWGSALFKSLGPGIEAARFLLKVYRVGLRPRLHGILNRKEVA